VDLHLHLQHHRQEVTAPKTIQPSCFLAIICEAGRLISSGGRANRCLSKCQPENLPQQAPEMREAVATYHSHSLKTNRDKRSSRAAQSLRGRERKGAIPIGRAALGGRICPEFQRGVQRFNVKELRSRCSHSPSSRLQTPGDLGILLYRAMASCTCEAKDACDVRNLI